ncbi:hypothetical protein ILUMI_18179 [Ignelater luminosus]|uniref:Uncharacterized protein n=1 Tax=Ignelater luminosus TaxID=2038154 RepID=A0A8K0CII3_IGNLU|nr:hypothetical protein ILUMI_18179 [Ignelater luminosus]
MSTSQTGEKQSTPKHTIETADFLAFNDKSFGEFCPTNSSSPQKQWKPMNRNNFQKTWSHQNRRFSGNFRGHSYGGNTDRSFHNKTFHGPYENYQQRSSFNRSFSSNPSTLFKGDSSYNSPQHSRGRGIDIRSYLHPSFTEDPWEALEKEKMNGETFYTDNEGLKESSTGSTEELPIET